MSAWLSQLPGLGVWCTMNRSHSRPPVDPTGSALPFGSDPFETKWVSLNGMQCGDRAFSIEASVVAPWLAFLWVARLNHFHGRNTVPALGAVQHRRASGPDGKHRL